MRGPQEPRTRKIVMTVFCLKEDAQQVRQSLQGWFASHDCVLADVRIDVLMPSAAEDVKALDDMGEEVQVG